MVILQRLIHISSNLIPKTTKSSCLKLFLFYISMFHFVLFCMQKKIECVMVRLFINIFYYIETKVCNKHLGIKTAVFFGYNIVQMTLITENKHLSRDPQLSSVTRNCQMYRMQMNALKTGFFKLKELLKFIMVRMTLNN